jgi:hypothetical protein
MGQDEFPSEKNTHVMLGAAKHLMVWGRRSFTPFRVTDAKMSQSHFPAVPAHLEKNTRQKGNTGIPQSDMRGTSLWRDNRLPGNISGHQP